MEFRPVGVCLLLHLEVDPVPPRYEASDGRSQLLPLPSQHSRPGHADDYLAGGRCPHHGIERPQPKDGSDPDRATTTLDRQPVQGEARRFRHRQSPDETRELHDCPVQQGYLEPHDSHPLSTQATALLPDTGVDLDVQHPRLCVRRRRPGQPAISPCGASGRTQY